MGRLKGYCLISIFLSTYVFSQTDKSPFWSQLNGPYVAGIRTMSAKPNGIIIIGTATAGGGAGNLFRSSNGGRTWNEIKFDGNSIVGVNASAADPGNAFYITAGGGDTYRSKDNGQKWMKVASVRQGVWVNDLVCDTRGIVYAAGNGLHRSTDQGKTWIQISPVVEGSAVGLAEVVCDKSDYVYATDHTLIYYGGKSTSILTSVDLHLTTLWLARGYDGSVFAEGWDQSSQTTRVFQSLDHGTSWNLLVSYPWSAGPFADNVNPFAAHPSGDLLLGLDKGGWADPKYIARLKAADNWSVDTVLTVYNEPVSKILCDPAGAVILVGTGGNGVYRSSDNGATWNQTGTNTSAVDIFTRTNGSNLFVHSQETGSYYFRSTDNGGSWTTIGQGLSEFGSSAFVGISNGTLFAATEGGILRSTDNGDTWVFPPNAAFPYNWVFTIVEVSPTLILAGTGNGIYKTTDNGDSWHQIYNVLSETIYPASNGSIFSASHGIVRSTDNGATWVQLDTTLAVRNFAFLSGRMFATTTKGLYTSFDNGTTWAANGFNRKDLNSILTTPNNSIYVQASSTVRKSQKSGGIYVSTDNGTIWNPVNDGLPKTNIVGIGLSSDGHLLAGSFFGGV
ncbi:MAG TPA: hypothetical protein VKS81_11870, partial [Bacteroidota bacterium]|nr:hypothetical protein [Bacteroidota bacterium]